MEATVQLTKSKHSDTWCNTADYSDKAKPIYWVEITKFIFTQSKHSHKKDLFRVWIIQTADGMFPHPDANVNHYCNGYDTELSFEQAKEKAEEVLSLFVGCKVNVQFN